MPEMDVEREALQQAWRGTDAGLERGAGGCTVLLEVSHAQLENNDKGSSFTYWWVVIY